MNLLAIFTRPKSPVHVVPRFHAATKAEQRKADDAAKATRGQLYRLFDSLTEEQREAAINRAKQRQGRAGQ